MDAQIKFLTRPALKPKRRAQIKTTMQKSKKEKRKVAYKIVEALFEECKKSGLHIFVALTDGDGYSGSCMGEGREIAAAIGVNMMANEDVAGVVIAAADSYREFMALKEKGASGE